MKATFNYRTHRGITEQHIITHAVIGYDSIAHPEFGYFTPGWAIMGNDASKGGALRTFRFSCVDPATFITEEETE